MGQGQKQKKKFYPFTKKVRGVMRGVKGERSMSNHTMTPWRFIENENGSHHITALTSGAGDIADLYHKTSNGDIYTKYQAEANGRFIVKGVNCHEDLVGALEEIHTILRCGGPDAGVLRIVEDALVKVEAHDG